MTQTTTLGQRQQIEIAAIEAELAALWRHAPGHDAPQLTRACVMTLVAPVLDQAAAQLAGAATLHLTDRFPNRTIVIDARPDDQEDVLDAWVQANCQMPAAGRAQVCCEQVTIDARGPAVERASGVVLPLLVPDVPVVLWWPSGDPQASPLFAQLSELADRVIVDSATFAQPEPQLRALLKDARAHKRVSDLAWARLTPWRELLAQFFDSAASAAQVHTISSVRVQYELPEAVLDRVQPLMLVGWLAAKLGWQPLGALLNRADAALSLRRPDGGSVEVMLVPQAVAAPAAARITAVELRTAIATYQVGCSSATNCATARVQPREGAAIQRVVRLEQLAVAELLAEDLRLFGRDRAYEATLRALAAISEPTA
ncbi:MAG: glucose-6-phosphate dehydrogenase assembly protein OpcA [Roseiflexaceae bacterium]|nr:glucose-6-phosphate dehydrogenase assembly protein OpcA [Roseiflexaceae bacterium]